MSDLISRLSDLRSQYNCFDVSERDAYGTLSEAIKVLSAQPERKKGKWIDVTNGRGGHECDECHNYAPAWQTGEERLTDFCPNCGADMKGEDDETD